MLANAEPEDFGSQGSQKEECLKCIHEVVDVWEPQRRKPEAQSPKHEMSSHMRDASIVEVIEAWLTLRQEQMRQRLAWVVVGFCMMWLVVGLIDVLITGNAWLMVSSGLLPILFKKPLLEVFLHYFQPNKS